MFHLERACVLYGQMKVHPSWLSVTVMACLPALPGAGSQSGTPKRGQKFAASKRTKSGEMSVVLIIHLCPELCFLSCCCAVKNFVYCGFELKRKHPIAVAIRFD